MCRIIIIINIKLICISSRAVVKKNSIIKCMYLFTTRKRMKIYGPQEWEWFEKLLTIVCIISFQAITFVLQKQYAKLFLLLVVGENPECEPTFLSVKDYHVYYYYLPIYCTSLSLSLSLQTSISRNLLWFAPPVTLKILSLFCKWSMILLLSLC